MQLSGDSLTHDPFKETRLEGWSTILPKDVSSFKVLMVLLERRVHNTQPPHYRDQKFIFFFSFVNMCSIINQFNKVALNC